MVTVPCPLRGCDSAHEVRLDRSGNQFIACKTWRNSIWFRGVGESYLNGNGGAIRANPSSEPRTIQEARAMRAGFQGRPNPNDEDVTPEELADPDQVAALIEREKARLRARGIDPDLGF